MGTVEWGPEVAAGYDADVAEMFDPAVLEPTVAFLADLAGYGAALELAVGTGRVALPLSARGVQVHGIELSPHMAAQLQEKPGADRIGSDERGRRHGGSEQESLVHERSLRKIMINPSLPGTTERRLEFPGDATTALATHPT